MSDRPLLLVPGTVAHSSTVLPRSTSLDLSLASICRQCKDGIENNLFTAGFNVFLLPSKNDVTRRTTTNSTKGEVLYGRSTYMITGISLITGLLL